MPINEVVRTVNALSQIFTEIYPINHVVKTAMGTELGIAMGRYPDDHYSGFDFSVGNPWFITTLALGEFACDLKKAGYAPNQRDQLKHTALGQFNRVLNHLSSGGSMSEQYRRDNGFEQGAHDLTWSYTSYMTAYRACF